MSEEVEKEISEMIDQLEGNGDTTPKPEVTPEPKVEVNEVVEAKEDPKPEEKEEIPPEPKPEPTPEPVITPDPKDQKIADLEARLAALEKPVVKEPDKPAVSPITEQAFIPDDTDLDELTRDPKKLNETFNKVYQQAVQDTRTAFSAELPNLIAKQIEVIQHVKETTEKFYKENEDLGEFKNVVSVVYGDLAKANPNQTFNDLMAATAAETRKRLKLPAPKPKEVKKANDPPPSLPKAGRKAGEIKEVKSEGIESELEAMDKAVNS
jgi:hypothetical protein